MPTLQACLNGPRDHPVAPRTPQALEREARAAVAAGATSLHVHAYDSTGRESLDPVAVADTVSAVRAGCGADIPISVSSGAYIENSAERRAELIASWTVLPDVVSANFFEANVLDLCELLLSRGLAVEAAMMSVADARAFVASGMADHCSSMLVEAFEEDVDAAIRTASGIEAVLSGAGIRLEGVYHGYGSTSWAVQRYAAGRGHGIRAGLEDVTVLPDGRPALGNGEIVAAAAMLLARALPDGLARDGVV